MKPTLNKLLLGAALGVTMLSAAAPGNAQRWREHGDAGGRAAAGVAGLAIGAGLAAQASADRDRWYRDNGRDPNYDDGFYRTRGYYPNDGYYASRYNAYEGCRVEKRYDSYSGAPILLRACN